MVLKNSNKIKLIYWKNIPSYMSTVIGVNNNNKYNNVPLVLSADFILDQDDFWNSSSIPLSVIKIWKYLHKNYFVIWIIRR